MTYQTVGSRPPVTYHMQLPPLYLPLTSTTKCWKLSCCYVNVSLSHSRALSFSLARLLAVFINLSEPLPLHSPLFRVGPYCTIVGTPTTTRTPPTILIAGHPRCVIPTAVTPGTRAPRVTVAQAAALARHPRPIYKGGVDWHVVACHIMYVKFVQCLCCEQI